MERDNCITFYLQRQKTITCLFQLPYLEASGVTDAGWTVGFSTSKGSHLLLYRLLGLLLLFGDEETGAENITLLHRKGRSQNSPWIWQKISNCEGKFISIKGKRLMIMFPNQGNYTIYAEVFCFQLSNKYLSKVKNEWEKGGTRSLFLTTEAKIIRFCTLH